MAIRGQRNRISSFVKPPLPKEVYREKSLKHQMRGEYQDIVHEINKGWYSSGVILKTIQRVEKVLEEIIKKRLKRFS